MQSHGENARYRRDCNPFADARSTGRGLPIPASGYVHTDFLLMDLRLHESVFVLLLYFLDSKEGHGHMWNPYLLAAAGYVDSEITAPRPPLLHVGII